MLILKDGSYVTNLPKVLVAIPAYNEEECIEGTILELKRVAPEFDFVVINDGSRDCTLELCTNLGCNVINMLINCGLTVGFQTAACYALENDYDYMVQFDADGQHRPEYISELVSKAQFDNADIVIGSRFLSMRKDMSMRMFGSRMITFLIKMLTGKRISDPTSGFRLFNRDVLKNIPATIRSILNPSPSPSLSSKVIRYRKYRYPCASGRVERAI